MKQRRITAAGQADDELCTMMVMYDDDTAQLIRWTDETFAEREFIKVPPIESSQLRDLECPELLDWVYVELTESTGLDGVDADNALQAVKLIPARLVNQRLQEALRPA